MSSILFSFKFFMAYIAISIAFTSYLFATAQSMREYATALVVGLYPSVCASAIRAIPSITARKLRIAFTVITTLLLLPLLIVLLVSPIFLFVSATGFPGDGTGSWFAVLLVCLIALYVAYCPALYLKKVYPLKTAEVR